MTNMLILLVGLLLIYYLHQRRRRQAALDAPDLVPRMRRLWSLDHD